MVGQAIFAFGVLLALVYLIVAVLGCTMQCMKTKFCLLPFTLILIGVIGVNGIIGYKLFEGKGGEYLQSRCDMIVDGSLVGVNSFEHPFLRFIWEYDHTIQPFFDH